MRTHVFSRIYSQKQKNRWKSRDTVPENKYNKKGKGRGGRHFFHQIEPNWPLPYSYSTVPVPQLRDARSAGWVTYIAVYVRVQCRDPKQGRKWINSIVKTIHSSYLPVIYLHTVPLSKRKSLRGSISTPLKGVVESLFNISVYLCIKDCSGMNIQFNNIAHSCIYWVFRYHEIINI